MKNAVPLFLSILFLAGGAAASWVLIQAMGETTNGAGSQGSRAAAEATGRGEVRLAPVVEVAAEVPAAAPAEVDPCILRNDEGILALERGDIEEAIGHFEFCIRTCPDEPAYRANLAEACGRLAVKLHQSEREVERARAIPLMRRATELAPERALPRSLLERWERVAEAEDGFERMLTEHFEVVYEFDRDEVRSEIDSIGVLLEDAYLEFGEAFASFPVEGGRRRIRVVLYTREEFDAVTGVGDWVGGIFDGTIRIPVASLTEELPRVSRVLRHELLHAFVDHVGGADVPGWLNEGLAQLLETRSTSIREAAITHARQHLKGTRLFELERLAGSLAGWSDAEEVARAYSQALALVGSVHDQYGERVLFEMISGCALGRSPEATFRTRIGLDLAVLVDDLQAELDR